MYQEFKLVAGHLKERNGRYYVVVSYTDTTGKRISREFSTRLPVKGNKKKADDILQRIRREESEKLYTQRRMQSGGETIDTTTRFTQFLSDWLEMMRASVESTTFSSYSMTIRNKVIPYFDKRFPKLRLIDVTPKHIQDYYTYELNVCGVSANTVIHRHANIRKALDYAYKTGMIESNPADRVQRPKKEKFVSEPYSMDELHALLEAAKGRNVEFGIVMAAFYGLRRSEVVGLKWSAINFEAKTISIRHSVTETTVDGKRQIIPKDARKRNRAAGRCRWCRRWRSYCGTCA